MGDVVFPSVTLVGRYTRGVACNKCAEHPDMASLQHHPGLNVPRPLHLPGKFERFKERALLGARFFIHL
jgi:hypothetical protein